MDETTRIKFLELDGEIRNLIQSSIEAREKAYAPYSQLKIGAALLCPDGAVVQGCNVENGVYPLTSCAEKTAVCRAISESRRHFTHIAICGVLRGKVVPPCGSCRQTLAEFVEDIVVYLVQPDKSEIVKTSLKALLPMTFRLE